MSASVPDERVPEGQVGCLVKAFGVGCRGAGVSRGWGTGLGVSRVCPLRGGGALVGFRTEWAEGAEGAGTARAAAGGGNRRRSRLVRNASAPGAAARTADGAAGIRDAVAGGVVDTYGDHSTHVTPPFFFPSVQPVGAARHSVRGTPGTAHSVHRTQCPVLNAQSSTLDERAERCSTERKRLVKILAHPKPGCAGKNAAQHDKATYGNVERPGGLCPQRVECRS